MDKSKFPAHKIFNKSNIALVCILCMFAGFMVSRALLSVAIVAFGANALWNVNPLKWPKQRYWLLGVCWIAMYAISYFWSSNIAFWNERLQVKLPVLLLPLSFAFIPPFNKKQLNIYTIVLSAMLMAGCCYSYAYLYHNFNKTISDYNVSHILPTPAKGDHIRYSLAITLAIIWNIYIWPQLATKGIKWFIGFATLFFVIYLYILSAKTGLLSLALFIACWGIYLLCSKKLVSGMGVIVTLLAITYLSGAYLPTFRTRIAYISYTYQQYRQGNTAGNYGDINRLMSYNVAWDIIKQRPVAGVGAGDILAEMQKGYARKYPLINQQYVLIPHNQFLTVAVACGIPAALLFALWVFAPLANIKRNREGFFFFSIWLILFFQLMLEPVLEVQFGVFVYLFFILWQRQELITSSPAVRNNIYKY